MVVNILNDEICEIVNGVYLFINILGNVRKGPYARIFVAQIRARLTCISSQITTVSVKE